MLPAEGGLVQEGVREAMQVWDSLVSLRLVTRFGEDLTVGEVLAAMEKVMESIPLNKHGDSWSRIGFIFVLRTSQNIFVLLWDCCQEYVFLTFCKYTCILR